MKNKPRSPMGASKAPAETKARTLRQHVAQLKSNRKQISQELEINRLQIRTEQLNLTLTALCRYLTEEGLVDESKLANIIQKIELENDNGEGKKSYSKPTRPSLLTPDPS